MTQRMRIAVIGAGGVGGYFGAVLARAGNDVTLLARGAHLAAIRSNGLAIRSERESFTLPLPATDDPAELTGADLAVIAVKSYSLHEVAPIARALALEGAAIVPLLNGVEATDDLEREGVPREQLLGGLTMVSAAKREPGVIDVVSWRTQITIGELDGTLSPRAQRIALTLEGAGIETTATEQIQVALWRKFNMLCAMAAACGMARSDVHGIRDIPLGRRLIERAVGEIAAVGRAKGVPIPEDQEAETMRRIDALPGTMKPSFLLDLERGGPTELDVLSGAVSRYGDEAGVPTPVHDTAAAVLRTDRR
jgi:2-dehydropantoate 2-reductase